MLGYDKKKERERETGEKGREKNGGTTRQIKREGIVFRAGKLEVIVVESCR